MKFRINGRLGLPRAVAFQRCEVRPRVCFEVLCREMRTLTACDTKTPHGVDLLSFAIPVALFFMTNLVALAQSIPPGRRAGPGQTAPLRTHHKLKRPSLLTPSKAPTLQEPYQPFTPRESFHRFTSNTTDPVNLVGGVFDAALGTAPNRPKEYGPHWGGFADRYGIGVTSSVTENALEAGADIILREDPRYFRVPDRPFKARVGNVLRFTFVARGGRGNLRPAYARYTTIFGSNFLSNTWRVQSEANAHDALLRTSEDFGGRLASNAFQEFWPDVKRRLFHIHH